MIQTFPPQIVIIVKLTLIELYYREFIDDHYDYYYYITIIKNMICWKEILIFYLKKIIFMLQLIIIYEYNA